MEDATAGRPPACPCRWPPDGSDLGQPRAAGVHGVLLRGISAPGELSADLVDLYRALSELPRGQREAIALFHLAELSVAQVAEQLGVPVGTVKARLARGRAALAHRLAVDDEEVLPR
jgi:RNA polymerase sigma-70 factor (ECF subfamily)